MRNLMLLALFAVAVTRLWSAHQGQQPTQLPGSVLRDKQDGS